MRALVTGGSGFIGSNLVKRLLNMGWEVSVTVKYKSIIDNVRISSVWQKLDVIEVDLRNSDSCTQFKDQHYDIVFHLAAYNHVGDSFLHVQESLTSNILATSNLMESGIKYGRFVYTATSEVYGFQEEVPFKEDMLPFPISPYAIGKYSGELYAQMKRVKENAPICVVRPFNTFGPYQSERAVIPELIIKCLMGETVETTEGTQTREFNFVDNIVDGFIALGIQDPMPDVVVNIGSNHEIPIRDLVVKIHQACDSASELKIGALQNRPTEIWRMCADYSRAKELLGWTPKVSFDDGLTQTVDWYKRYIESFYNKSSALNQL